VIVGIDHIGVATDDLAAVGAMLTVLGMDRTDSGLAEAYGVACEFWQYAPGAGQTSVELVAPARLDTASWQRLIETTHKLARRGHCHCKRVGDGWFSNGRYDDCYIR
jgi:hypothetical protein